MVQCPDVDRRCTSNQKAHTNLAFFTEQWAGAAPHLFSQPAHMHIRTLSKTQENAKDKKPEPGETTRRRKQGRCGFPRGCGKQRPLPSTRTPVQPTGRPSHSQARAYKRCGETQDHREVGR